MIGSGVGIKPLEVHHTGVTIGWGAGSRSLECYNKSTPTEINVPGFDNGKRLRVVIVPTTGGDRFNINFRTPSDIALHFNPRFDGTRASRPRANLHEFRALRNSSPRSFWRSGPSGKENTVVFNTTRSGNWMHEERTTMPFRHGRVYTLEFIANHGRIQVLLNGAMYYEFVERLPGSHVIAVEIAGDVHVHSLQLL